MMNTLWRRLRHAVVRWLPKRTTDTAVPTPVPTPEVVPAIALPPISKVTPTMAPVQEPSRTSVTISVTHDLGAKPDTVEGPIVGQNINGQPIRMSEVKNHYGYVYRVEHIPTGRYYIGRHRYKTGEGFKDYLGSGSRWRDEVLSKTRSRHIRKEILAFAETEAQLAKLEVAFIFGEAVKNNPNFMNVDKAFRLAWIREENNLLDPYETWGLGSVRKIGKNWVASYRIMHEEYSTISTLRVVRTTEALAVSARKQELIKFANDLSAWNSGQRRKHARKPVPCNDELHTPRYTSHSPSVELDPSGFQGCQKG